MKPTIFVCGLLLLAGCMQGISKAQVASPCGVPAFPVSNPAVPTAISILDPVTGHPEILFNPLFFNSLGAYGPPMFRYMLAHECAHHLSGDVIAAHLNPQGMLMINPQIELRADCNAAIYLKQVGDGQAIQVAISFWSQSGNAQTGPNYPTGNQRAQIMTQCAQ